VAKHTPRLLRDEEDVNSELEGTQEATPAASTPGAGAALRLRRSRRSDKQGEDP